MPSRLLVLLLVLLAAVLPASARADDPDGDPPPEEFRTRKEILSVALGGGVLAGPALPPAGGTAGG
jgi:hypothetical protein